MLMFLSLKNEVARPKVKKSVLVPHKANTLQHSNPFHTPLAAVPSTIPDSL